MANRQEFTRDVRAQIKTRCLRPTGYACEKCGLILKSGGEIHHVKQDAMKRDEDKKRELMRKSLKLTQQDLASKVGLSRAQIANVEAGRTDMPLSTLKRYANAFGCTMKELIP